MIPVQLRSRRRPAEEFIDRSLVLVGMVSIVVLLLIFLFLIKESLPLFRIVSFTDFILGSFWYPTSEPPAFGILPLILGSLLVTAGAVVIAVPLGVAVALYIAEVAPEPVRELLKPLIELLAGIPSVVIGFVGMVLLAPAVKGLFGLPTGLTALTGSILLGFMALPTVVSISEDALRAVPRSYREGSLALGASQWETMLHTVLPAARSGIVAAAMLGIGRVVGETMAVLMVTGNSPFMPPSLFRSVRTMTGTIAAEMGEAVHGSDHYHALFAVGVVLFAMTFVVNLVAGMALRQGEKR